MIEYGAYEHLDALNHYILKVLNEDLCGIILCPQGNKKIKADLFNTF